MGYVKNMSGEWQGDLPELWAEIMAGMKTDDPLENDKGEDVEKELSDTLGAQLQPDGSAVDEPIQRPLAPQRERSNKTSARKIILASGACVLLVLVGGGILLYWLRHNNRDYSV